MNVAEKQTNKRERWHTVFITIPVKSMLLGICFLMAVPIMVCAQNSNLEIKPNFEKIKTTRFLKKTGKEGKKMELKPDGTVIFYFKLEKGYSHIIYPPDSYIGLYKSYYSNGNISKKGLVFTESRFSIGTWYYYDMEGNLIREVDQDEPYSSFNLEKILEFARQKGVVFLTSPEVWKKKSAYPILNRDDGIIEDYYYGWSLSWVTEDGRYRKNIQIDRTGFLLSQSCELIQKKKTYITE